MSSKILLQFRLITRQFVFYWMSLLEDTRHNKETPHCTQTKIKIIKKQTAPGYTFLCVKYEESALTTPS